MNELLIQEIKKVLGNSFVMYFKAHTYHWNVTGADFKQYHDLFGGIYEEVYGSVDTTAEFIRALDGFTPTSLPQIVALSMISEDDEPVSAMSMVNRLLDANQIVLASLYTAYQEADNATELGIANYLQDRIAAHQKHGWMLKATLK